MVSLRITRPRFPWPPLAETVAEAVSRLIEGAPRPAPSGPAGLTPPA
jgi:hypothetical protein